MIVGEMKWALIVHRSSIKHDQCSTCRISVHCQSSPLHLFGSNAANRVEEHIRLSFKMVNRIKILSWNNYRFDNEVDRQDVEEKPFGLNGD